MKASYITFGKGYDTKTCIGKISEYDNVENKRTSPFSNGISSKPTYLPRGFSLG